VHGKLLWALALGRSVVTWKSEREAVGLKVEDLLSVRHMYRRYKDSISQGKDSISKGEQKNSVLVLAVLVGLWGWDWQQGHERFSRQLYLDS